MTYVYLTNIKEEVCSVVPFIILARLLYIAGLLAGGLAVGDAVIKCRHSFLILFFNVLLVLTCTFKNNHVQGNRGT
jgi:hypothetical protein